MITIDAISTLEDYNTGLQNDISELHSCITETWLRIGATRSEYYQLLRHAPPDMQNYLHSRQDTYNVMYPYIHSPDPTADIDAQINKLNNDAQNCEKRATELWRYNPYKKKLLEKADAYNYDAAALAQARPHVPDVLISVAKLRSLIRTMTSKRRRVVLCIEQKKESILKEAMEGCE